MASTFGLDDVDFWSDPLKEPVKVTMSSALALDAPSVVPLHSRDTFPLVARYRQSLKERFTLDFRANAVIAAIDLDRDEFFAGFALDRDGLEPIEPPDDDVEIPDATIVSPYVLELREQVDLPWRRADYVVYVVVRSTLSPKVRVSVGAARGAYHDPAVDAFLEAAKVPPRARRASPPEGDELPSYQQRAASPPLPSSPAIALAVAATTDLVVHGSFRLPTADPFAVIHLLLIGDRDATPITLTLEVPTRRDGDDAIGWFALALSPHVGVLPRPERYALYAFSRDVVGASGPIDLR